MNLQTEEIDSLSELIEGDRLGVVSVEVSEGCSQVLESFVELLRDKAKEFVEACLLSSLMLSCNVLLIMKVLIFGDKATRLVG